jgi:predicted membrane protein
VSVSNAPRGTLFAALLIGAGALLFLDNIGVIGIRDPGAYWPVWMIAVGVLILDRRRGKIAAIWAGAFIVSGTLILLGNLRVVHVTADIVYPIALIAFGCTMLARPKPFSDWPRGLHFIAAQGQRRYTDFRNATRGAAYTGNSLNEAVVFSSLNRRLDTQNFEGGKVDVACGSIELDLSGCRISAPERQAAIEANAVFGGIEITVPRTWKVVMKNSAVFGGCDNKTVPPRPEAGLPPETLIVSGSAAFGGITVRN